MNPRRGKQQNLWMGCKQWMSSISVIPWSQGHWRMFSEDLEPGRGYCHGSSCEWWINGYLGTESGERNDLVLRKGGDVGGRRDGIGMLEHGGAIICYDKEVVWGVATSDDVAWLYWYELCWWCVRSWLDIQMVHRSMWNDSRVADEVYIKRGCLVLEGFLFFPLYSFSCIAKQARLWPSVDSCHVLIPSMQTSKHLVPMTISHYRYHYHLRPTPPVTTTMCYLAPASAEEAIKPFGLHLQGQYKWFQHWKEAYHSSMYHARVTLEVDVSPRPAPYEQSDVSALFQTSEPRHEAL